MEEQRKKILFLSGTRADFGKLKPLIQKVKASPQFEYSIFVTGMHMLSQYGSTWIEIQKAGFENFYKYINQDGSINSQMDLVLANTIHGLAHYIREFTPNMIVVHGDRIETLAGAIVGSLNNILVSHIEGGEISGTIDESLRHAVSKLSHLHFVANEEACQRLVQMGEAEETIFVIGSPDIDVMLSDDLPHLSELKKKYEIGFPDYAIFIYHPVTTELDKTQTHIDTVLEALQSSGLNFVVLYPNNDAGSEIILRRFSGIVNHPRFRMLPSMRFEYFLTLLKNATAIVGNSSSGMREAPVYGVPTINIGTRQANRFRYPTILNVCEDKDAILHAFSNLPKSVKPCMYFGEGNSAEGFMRALCNPNLWGTPSQKQFRDLSFDRLDLVPFIPKLKSSG
jgi:UDP-N-acetylglucosamine 2-epimerase (hydrolysing)